ncbi:hypothetical protein HDV06_005013 [Boothiomyces sp. JEL0866]|nr:hypothetical protein HDV06_005013 [Boothiomyces sp. JEL0866]
MELLSNANSLVENAHGSTELVSKSNIPSSNTNHRNSDSQANVETPKDNILLNQYQTPTIPQVAITIQNESQEFPVPFKVQEQESLHSQKQATPEIVIHLNDTQPQTSTGQSESCRMNDTSKIIKTVEASPISNTSNIDKPKLEVTSKQNARHATVPKSQGSPVLIQNEMKPTIKHNLIIQAKPDLTERKQKKEQGKESKNGIINFNIVMSSYFTGSAMPNAAGMSASSDKLNEFTTLVFHPYSLASQFWNSLYSIVMLFTVIYIPLCLSCPNTFGGGLDGISVTVTVMVLLDVLIKYRTGIFIGKHLETDLKKICEHHIKNFSIAFDTLVIIPWVYVADSITSGTSMESSVYSTRLLSLINVLPFVENLFSKRRVGFLSTRMTNFMRINGINAALVDSIMILLAMIFYWHWNACSVMILRRLSISENSFFTSEYEEYSSAVFSAAGEMLANGWGSTLPGTNIDRWLTIFNMIVSATFLALFIGNISAFMIGLDTSGKRFNELLEEVNQFVRFKGFGDHLKDRIVKYYQFKYSDGKYFDENRILMELNQPLKQYIALRECQDLIVKVPFFKDGDKFFIAQVVMILKVNYYLPGDYVIEEGTTGDQMYFIASGTVEAIVNGVARAKLSPGSFFGEIALLFGRMKRTASIRAFTHCRLYSLSRKDLNSILELNPYMADRMKQVASDRLAQDEKAKAAKAQEEKEKERILKELEEKSKD